MSNAPPIQINGYSVHYSSGTTLERKKDIICRRYEFWTYWRVIRRADLVGTPTNNLILAFIDAAKTRTNQPFTPMSHWVALDDMNVTQTTDGRHFPPVIPPPHPLVCL